MERPPAKYWTDTESTGQGHRVTRCVECGLEIRNEYPYVKGEWRDGKGQTVCTEEIGGHRPAKDWDKRRAGR